ncbi:O-antigen ligase family protein [Acetobacterium sp.]|uniref:O-antigen ligase family protein n=1 Tax=Acetobacterium sp. TaxID=1872094 RepID=UPI0035934B6C
MKLKIKRINIQIYFILIISMSYLYLIDIKTGILGVTYENISYLICLVWCSYWIWKTSWKKKGKFEYTPWVLGGIGLVLVCMIQSSILYHQSIVDTLSPQRRILVWSLVYFAISSILKNGYINKSSFVKILENIGIIQLLLCFIQYFLSQNVELLHVYTINSTARGLRYYYMPILFVFLMFVKLDSFTTDKGIRKIKDLVIIAAILLEIVVVQKYRMTSIGLLICLIIFVLLMINRQQYKIGYVILGCIVVGFLISTDYYQNILNAIFSGGDAYLATRTSGRTFYLASIASHPILGCGYPSASNVLSLNASGNNEGILLNDNGLIGFVYLYGSFGLVWFITLWIKLLRNGWSIFKKYNLMVYFLFPLFFIITSLTEAHWYWEHGYFFLMIFLALIEEYKGADDNNNNCC